MANGKRQTANEQMANGEWQMANKEMARFLFFVTE
jgi:hypothetical protein